MSWSSLLGWFYSLPMIGKTIFTSCYANASAWFKRTFLHPVATTLTVDKLSRNEVEEMLAAEQRAIARRALQEKFGDRQLNLSLERLEFLRRRALRARRRRTVSGGTLLRAFRRRRDRLRRRPAKFLWHQSTLGLRTHRAHHTNGFYLQRAGPYGRNRAADHGAHPEFRQISALLRPRQHLGKQSLRSRPGLRRLRGQFRQSQRARPGAHGQQAPGAGSNWRRTASPFHKTLISSPGSMTRRPIASSSSIWKTFRRPIAKTCCSSSGTLSEAGASKQSGTLRPVSRDRRDPARWRKPAREV